MYPKDKEKKWFNSYEMQKDAVESNYFSYSRFNMLKTQGFLNLFVKT